MWAMTKGTGLSESISYGGNGVAGFGVGAAGDPAASLSAAQSTWVMNALNDLNTKILASTGTSCPTWGADLKSMTGCFQIWWNANYPTNKQLRTDGVFDQDTLSAITSVAAAHPADFPSAPIAQTPSAAATTAKKKMSTGAIVGIAAAGAAVVGGAIYMVTRKKKGR